MGIRAHGTRLALARRRNLVFNSLYTGLLSCKTLIGANLRFPLPAGETQQPNRPSWTHDSKGDQATIEITHGQEVIL